MCNNFTGDEAKEGFNRSLDDLDEKINNRIDELAEQIIATYFMRAFYPKSNPN